LRGEGGLGSDKPGRSVLHPLYGSADRSWRSEQAIRGTGLNRERHELEAYVLLVYHGELTGWTLSVYKLLIARKKVGKPLLTVWYLI